MKYMPVMLLGLLAGAGAAFADSALQEPRFQLPSIDQVLPLYPEAAKKAGLSAVVEIACVWDETGHLTCRTLSETPPGQGFGEATVKLFEAYGRALDVTSPSPPGQEKTFRFRWAIL